MPDDIVCLACGGIVDPPKESPARPCRCATASPEAKAILCPTCGGSLAVGVRACPYCASTLATCRCAACLAWNLAGAAHCQACGRVLVSSEASGSAAAYGCPRCKAELKARTYGDLGVEECDACGGLFLAPQTMDRLVAARDMPTNLRLHLPRRALKAETVVRYLFCPVCGKSMNRQAFARISGVVVDVCKADGIWFDAGELAAVIEFVERGGLERERERQLAELDERERRVRGVELNADRMDGLGADFLSVHRSSAHSGPLQGAEVLEFMADLWRKRYSQ